MENNKNANKIDVHALQSLLPQAVIQFASTIDNFQPPLKQSFRAVTLFADVSGFTKLSEAFAIKGPQGAEELAFFLNRYMEQLIRHIARAGGDVFKFAGDAMLALWVLDNEIVDTVQINLALQEMAHRAVQASLAIQNEMSEAMLTEGVTLSVKIGIGIGNATVLHVGGVFGRVEYFACGVPLMQAFKSESEATPGDVIVCPEAWEILNDSFDGTEVKDGFIKVTKQTKFIRNFSVSAQSKGKTNVFSDFHEFETLLGRYVPRSVIPYLSKNQKTWSGELRLVTVLFINIGVNLSSVQEINTSNLTWIQEVITGIQNCVYKYEGSLNKFLVDDKGSNVIAVFGVPPLAHYDDATRGVLSAVKLINEMKNLGIRCCIGVTSGLVYTGLLGSGSSREYGVLGDAVNLSARLMAKLKDDYSISSGVLCDQSTKDLITQDAPIRFDTLEPFFVKGKAEKIVAYSPKYTETHLKYCPKPHYFDVASEILLNDIKTRLQQSTKSFVELIEAPIGTGKTYLLENIGYLVTQNLDNPSLLWAAAYNFVSGSHLVWKRIFETLLQKNRFTENRSYRTHVKSVFTEKDSELTPYLELANDIFGTQFLESEKCENLDNESKFDKKTDCCLYVLTQFSAIHPICIFIDNSQWMKKDDWQITEFVFNMITQTSLLPNVYLFFSTRPVTSPLFCPRYTSIPQEYVRLRKQLYANQEVFILKHWNAVQVKQFMCEYFAVDDIQPPLASFIYERTGGNPAYTTWACETMDCLVTHSNGVMLLSMSQNGERAVTSEAPLQHPVPMQVHSALIGVIDRLTPSQIMLLKIASCVCMGQGSGSTLFDFDTVHQCLPIDEYKQDIFSDIEYLKLHNLIKPVDKLTYDPYCYDPNIFCHNHEFMHQSTFLSAIMEVSIVTSSSSNASGHSHSHINLLKRTNSTDNLATHHRRHSWNQTECKVWSLRLCHFFMNRISFFPFSKDTGVDWTNQILLPLNSRTMKFRQEKQTSNVLSLNANDTIFYLRCNDETINQWNTVLDAVTSNGLMTEAQEQGLIYPIESLKTVYSFTSGFFRDVIYGLMLLKQRQQIHDMIAKSLCKKWKQLNHNCENVPISFNDEFSEYRAKVISKHRDLALTDDTIRRMGSFKLAAPIIQSDMAKKSSHSIVSPASSIFKQKRSLPTAHSQSIRYNPTNLAGLKVKHKSIFNRIRQSITKISIPEP